MFVCRCGNSNFARRVECNKCGTPCPTGGQNDSSGGGHNRGGSGARYGGNRGGGGGGYDGNRGGGNYDGNRSGGYSDVGRGSSYDNKSSSSNRGGSYGGNQGRDDGGYNQVPPPSVPSYGGAGGNYAPPPNSYGGNANYGMEAVPPASYSGGPTSYPPSYGGPLSGYGSNAPSDGRSTGRGGPTGGYGAGGPRHQGGGGGGHGGAPADPLAKVKQCDENCDETCDNPRIYISNLPPDVTVEELRELFGGIGQVIPYPFFCYIYDFEFRYCCKGMCYVVEIIHLLI